MLSKLQHISFVIVIFISKTIILSQEMSSWFLCMCRVPWSIPNLKVNACLHVPESRGGLCFLLPAVVSVAVFLVAV